MSEHTPTPWTFTQCVTGIGFDIHRAEHNDGTYLNSNDVGYYVMTVYGADPYHIERANAELIVAACNAWDNADALRARIAELEGAK